jgi:hypothetical protein
MATDRMNIRILEDGTLVIETDKISGPNHINAEKALDFLSKEMGGKTVRERRPNRHVHEHTHDTEHEHEGGHTH